MKNLNRSNFLSWTKSKKQINKNIWWENNLIIWVQNVPSTVKKKVKWSRYRPSVAQRVGRGIALLFLDRGTRRGWVVSSTPQPHFTPGKDPVPILQEAGWAPGPVWTGGKSRPRHHIKVKVKWSRYRPSVAQRVGRGTALLFHDCSTRRGWVSSAVKLVNLLLCNPRV